MAKRIVKETLGDGRIRYRVETNRLFGFIPIAWTTDIDICTIDNFGTECSFFAIFDNLEGAQRFCGITPSKDEVVRKEVL